MDFCITSLAPDDDDYPEETLEEIVFPPTKPVQLFIRCHANGVDIVRCDGTLVARAYVGTSTAFKMRTVRFWLAAGYCGWDDPCAVSTSGGNGDSRYLGSIGRWDNIERYGKGIR